jgi:8-oxo-dGTP diphosphatase
MKTQNDSETLQPGQQVITACGFIYTKIDEEYRLFIAKRALTKKFLPGVFELVGGHVDYGEDLVNGLKREVREELSMEIKVGSPFASFTYINEIKQTHSIEVIFFAQFTDPIEQIRLNPEDHSEYIWASINDIRSTYAKDLDPDDPELKAILKGFEILNNPSVIIEFK